jgi:hypothetical protein
MGRLSRKKKPTAAETFPGGMTMLQCDLAVAAMLGIEPADLRNWVLVARTNMPDGQIHNKILPSRFGDFPWALRYLQHAVGVLRKQRSHQLAIWQDQSKNFDD